MKKLWKRIGFVAFWAVWPALWVYLHGGKRTRALILCGDEFLVVRGWLGSGKYGLPGGGLHRGENSLQGLIREVAEETGIALYEKDVKFLYSGHTSGHGLGFDYDCFVVCLAEKPPVHMQKYEISDYAWESLEDPGLPLSRDAQDILAYWQNKG